jgi:hypothetical protein
MSFATKTLNQQSSGCKMVLYRYKMALYEARLVQRLTIRGITFNLTGETGFSWNFLPIRQLLLGILELSKLYVTCEFH